MPATQQQAEALKQIGDLSKWIAAVETGAIAAIGALIKSNGPSPTVSWCFSISVAFFVISVLAAAGVLLSLPAAFQDIGENEKIWDRRATLGPITSWPLRNVMATQLFMFAFGIIGFGAGVIVTIANLGNTISK